MVAIAKSASEKVSALSSAVTRIADLWGFSNAKLGAILGLSAATVSRLRAGSTMLDPSSKSFEAGSAPAFKCDPGSGVDDDREPLVTDSAGAQAEHDVRRRSRSECFPEREVAADVISGLHLLREKLAEVR